MNFKQVLIYDRIREDLRIFCANKTINKVYNEQFLDIVEVVNCDVDLQIKTLGDGGVEILNLVIQKPDIPQDIKGKLQAGQRRQNYYKQYLMFAVRKKFYKLQSRNKY